jgi:adenylate cyclase
LLNVVLPKITADLSDHLRDIRNRQEAQTLDAELMTGERGRIAVSMKLTPLQDSEQQARGVAMVLDDVTDKREREQQLRIMKNYLPPEMVDNIHTISNLALGGERREVTCLFAEVRSLTTLKDVRPGEIMDTLNRYLAVATDCIHETQGIVDKYMGTEVMAIWNTQLSPQDNHAALAVECALLMRRRFRELYAELGLQPEPDYYRVGMHTGVATLGNVGSLSRRDFTAIGDTINLSKRLEENAQYGQIIISDDTRQHLNQHSNNGTYHTYHFEDLPPIQVKGRQQQTRIYEVFTDDVS